MGFSLFQLVHRAALRESTENKEGGVDLFSNTLIIFWFLIPAAVFFSLVIGGIYLSTSQDAAIAPANVKQGLAFWMLSAWMELLIEPVVIYAEKNMLKNIILNVELSAMALQTVYTGVSLLFFSTRSIILLQASGQFVYAISMVAGYYLYAYWIKNEIFQKIRPKTWKIDPLAKQSIIGNVK